MRVVLHEERCIGAGQCLFAAPEVFDQHDAGGVILLDEEPPVEQHENVRRAAWMCPGRVIDVRE